MRVVLSTWGRFHSFHLARQMMRFGWLEAVFTTFPRHVLRREGVPRDKLLTNPFWHTVLTAKQRLGFGSPRIDRMLARLVDESQNRFIQRRIPECDVFVALSGSGLLGGRVVQGRGGKWFCDRSSSHAAYADQLLKEEFARFRIPYVGTALYSIDKELQEYDEADRIIVPSEFAQRSFVEMGIDPAKVVRIPFGGDTSRFWRTVEPDPEAFTVFYCGQVSFRKGVPYLLEAFARLNHPRKKLFIAGIVLPEIKDFLTTVDLTGVTFLGHRTKDQLRDHYSGADVFAMASVEEGMANVQTEAMACGTPVITTVNAGGGELIREGVEGFVVPIRDPARLAEHLQQLADDRKLARKMGRAARKRIESLGPGGWDIYGDMYRELCQSDLR